MLDQQEKAMLKQVDMQIKAAQAEFDKNKNQENTIALLEAQQEKEELITQLRENLEQSGRRLQLEAQREENENMLSVLSGAPLKIYIG